MKRRMGWLFTFWLLVGGAAGAEEPLPPPAGAAPLRDGAITRQWLERQRQGRQAAPAPQPLSGPVQEQVYERYRKSFAHPIPERFDREQMSAGTGLH